MTRTSDAPAPRPLVLVILDGFGERMSKSKGNGIDPLDIIERYGADALRFGMVHLSTENQDSKLPVSNVCPHCGTQVPVKREVASGGMVSASYSTWKATSLAATWSAGML